MKSAIRNPPPLPVRQAGEVALTDLAAVQSIIGYTFSDPNLLLIALTHRSYRSLDLNGGDYERLEFLGDAVLGLIVSEKLYRDLDLPAGDLTKRTSQVVNRSACERVAQNLGLDRHVRVGPAASVEGTAIMSDVTEAILGAIYLDGGMDPSIEFVHRHFGVHLTGAVTEGIENPKAKLNEMFLKEHKAAPIYRVVETSGPDHAPTYVVEAMFETRVLGRGAGRSKREAESEAARSAIEQLLSGPVS